MLFKLISFAIIVKFYFIGNVNGFAFAENNGLNTRAFFRCFSGGRQGLCMSTDECSLARGTPLGICNEDSAMHQQCCLVYDVYDNVGMHYECGVAAKKFTRRGKIVNGSVTRYAEFPWQVYITIHSFRRNACGGTLISPEWVVTAAHCVVGNQVDKIHVLLGKYNLSAYAEPYPYQKRGVSEVHIHDHFNFNRGGEFDVALLKLDGKVDLAPNIIPICLPDAHADFSDQMGVVTGWGKTAWNEPGSPVLRMVALPILDENECRTSVRGYHASFLCAGFLTGGQDSCNGDSGGPLQVLGSNGRIYLAGIVSSGGAKCAEKGVIGIYSNVPTFVDWIKYTTII